MPPKTRVFGRERGVNERGGDFLQGGEPAQGIGLADFAQGAALAVDEFQGRLGRLGKGGRQGNEMKRQGQRDPNDQANHQDSRRASRESGPE